MSVDPIVINNNIRDLLDGTNKYYLIVHIGNADGITGVPDGFLGVIFPIGVYTTMEMAILARVDIVKKLGVAVAIVKSGDYLPLYVNPPSDMVELVNNMNTEDVKDELNEQIKRNRQARTLPGNQNNEHFEKVFKEIDMRISQLDNHSTLNDHEKDLLRLSYQNRKIEITKQLNNLSLDTEVLERVDTTSISYIINTTYRLATTIETVDELTVKINDLQLQVNEYCNNQSSDSNWKDQIKNRLVSRGEEQIWDTISKLF